MDLNRIQIFAQVVDKGSFTAAAKAMGITKATVSRKIAELEHSTGVQLLLRTTRSLKLTEAGSIYFNKVNKILTDLRSAEDQLSASQQTIRGNLRIVCPIEFGQQALGPVIAKFLEDYPQMQIEAELTNRKVDMVEEGIDVMFHVQGLDDPRLENFRLINAHKMLMASPEYLQKFGTPASPDELVKHKGIRLASPYIDGNWRIFDGKQWQEIIPDSRLQVNNITLAREAAIDGLGIASLPMMIAYDALQRGDLLPILQDFPMEHVTVDLIYPKRAYLPRKCRTFIEYFYEALFQRWGNLVLDTPPYVIPPENLAQMTPTNICCDH